MIKLGKGSEGEKIREKGEKTKQLLKEETTKLKINFVYNYDYFFTAITHNECVKISLCLPLRRHFID